ncbi:hypothetical protein RB195_019513 [Necator americanus]|uniref:Uncharacterized protein n=1 Tax=Necator americanus TaxID=51031 RepID=A0ABR1CG92_NECAM
MPSIVLRRCLQDTNRVLHMMAKLNRNCLATASCLTQVTTSKVLYIGLVSELQQLFVDTCHQVVEPFKHSIGTITLLTMNTRSIGDRPERQDEGQLACRFFTVLTDNQDHTENFDFFLSMKIVKAGVGPYLLIRKHPIRLVSCSKGSMLTAIFVLTPNPPTSLLSHVHKHSSSPVPYTAFSGWRRFDSVSPITSYLNFMACIIRSSTAVEVPIVILVLFHLGTLPGPTCGIQWHYEHPILAQQKQGVHLLNPPASQDKYKVAFSQRLTPIRHLVTHVAS